MTQAHPCCACCALGRGPAQVVDFKARMAPRQLLFWRACFEHLLAGAKRPEDAAAIFAKCAGLGLRGSQDDTQHAAATRALVPH